MCFSWNIPKLGLEIVSSRVIQQLLYVITYFLLFDQPRFTDNLCAYFCFQNHTRISSSPTLSSSAHLFTCCPPHQIQVKYTLHWPLLISYIRGIMRHPHVLALSHGSLSSTCNERKQFGQWFLEVLSAGGISLPHHSHINQLFSFFIVKFLVKFIKQKAYHRNHLLIIYNHCAQLLLPQMTE